MTYHIAADVGGTKTLIQLVRFENNTSETIKYQHYSSSDFSSFDELLKDFIDFDTAIDSACFAVAGPVVNKEDNCIANITNLPWIMDQNQIQANFSFAGCQLINDFQAIGYAIDALREDELLTLQEGTLEPQGTRAIIGAGTGLGQTICVHTGTHYKVLSTEGGHVDFAPRTPLEIELLIFLLKIWSHVSYERILSGPGIETLFEFFLQHHSLKRGSYTDIFNSVDPAAAIAMDANENPEGICAQSMTLFTQIYGAQAGNLALNCLPTGGLYIAGGIAAKNQTLINSQTFLDAFHAKGKMETLSKSIPIKLITNTNLGLIGATQVAQQIAENT